MLVNRIKENRQKSVKKKNEKEITAYLKNVFTLAVNT